MENKILAIKGHPTRGKEVIEILEMLGGKNKFNFIGNEDKWLVLNGNIQQTDFLFNEEGFTLEEFLEKYPYKVKDKVQHKGSTSWGTIYVIEKMIWEDNQIKYIVHSLLYEYSKCTVTAEELQPYKEEIKEEDNTNIHINPDIDNKTTCDIKINGMKVNINDYTVKSITKTDDGLIVEYIKNKPQYPKTYEECCLITEKVAKTTHELDIAYNPYLIYDFQKLLICRDAYWEIAGVEMGLSEPWKPKYICLVNNEYFTIHTFNNEIIKSGTSHRNAILAFPAEEVRDAFFENFKDLIEECKEFL